MNKQYMVPVDELAIFMNVAWPGEDWYLDGHLEYLWETTFTNGEKGALYQARQPGTLVNLADYEGRVRWQGFGSDPSRGRGFKLTDLFRRWQRTRRDTLLVVYVPRDRLTAVSATLEEAGCLLLRGDEPVSASPAETVTI